MAKYKVGDQVIIKSIEWYNENKNAVQEVVSKDRITFVHDMLTYCGKNATIVNVTNQGDYQLDIDEGSWGWSDFMLLDYTKEYKVGDMVRIKSLEWYNKNKDPHQNIQVTGELTFLSSMSKYCGKVARVTHKTACSYRINIDNGLLYWSSYMFEDIKSEKTEEVKLINADEITEPLDLPLGTIFKYKGKLGKVVMDGENTCRGCILNGLGDCTNLLACVEERREDNNSVIFTSYSPSEEPEWAEAEEIKEEIPVTNTGTPKIKTGISVIIEERLRQLTTKGYDNAHDDAHDKGELSKAAALFAWPALSDYVFKHEWPEGKLFYHPKEPAMTIDDTIKELGKAGALITAEIDRLYRLKIKRSLP